MSPTEPTTETSDGELLRQYADSRSEQAFTELVNRHVNWVHGLSQSRVRDSALADDITQAVFLTLANKSSKLRRAVSVTGWLYLTTRYAAAAQHVIPYPDGGDPSTVHNVWTTLVFGVWNPPVMICPLDVTQDPVEQHTYVLNAHMEYWNVKYSSRLPDGRSPSDVVLMGEKYTRPGGDYYMEYGDFARLIDPRKHSFTTGSNYLMLDMHVESQLITTDSAAEFNLDPWDFASGQAPPATAPNGGTGS